MWTLLSIGTEFDINFAVTRIREVYNEMLFWENLSAGFTVIS
jgi:hypothetical protein